MTSMTVEEGESASLNVGFLQGRLTVPVAVTVQLILNDASKSIAH